MPYVFENRYKKGLWVRRWRKNMITWLNMRQDIPLCTSSHYFFRCYKNIGEIKHCHCGFTGIIYTGQNGRRFLYDDGGHTSRATSKVEYQTALKV